MTSLSLGRLKRAEVVIVTELPVFPSQIAKVGGADLAESELVQGEEDGE